MKKKIFLSITAILLSVCCMAQEKVAFPFQGGKEIMTRFFKDSLAVNHEIRKRKATGVVICKFTADEKGGITKIVIYYADDTILVPPIIDAMKKSNHKWIIPDHEKFHEFIIQFSLNFNPPASNSADLQKAVYTYYRTRKPIISNNPVLLDMATFLPTVVVKYDLAD